MFSLGNICDWSNPEIDTRPVQEYLAALDQETIAAAAPRKISLSDPHSCWTAATGGIAFSAYSTNYLIDTANGVILDVEATPAHRTEEVESTRLMVNRVEDHFGIKPERLIADTAYGSAPMLGWVVEEKAIEPHIPVLDKTERKDGTWGRESFKWNKEADEYRCPAGKALRREWRPFKNPRKHITKADTIILSFKSA